LPLIRSKGQSRDHAPSLLATPDTQPLCTTFILDLGPEKPGDSTNQTSSHSWIFLNSFKICSKSQPKEMSGTIYFNLGQLGFQLFFYWSDVL
jgi:hypothetical protein